jgi:hypothetical protein
VSAARCPRGRGAVALLLLLAAARGEAPQDALSRNAAEQAAAADEGKAARNAAPILRAYELDVAAPERPSILPMAEPLLAEALRAQGFDAVVLWLSPSDARASGRSIEPRAALLDLEVARGDALAPAAAPFLDAGLRVAVGRREADDPTTLPAALAHREIRIERSDGPAVTLRRVVRPGVRRIPWAAAAAGERESGAGSAGGGGIALSSRLVLATAPELVQRQTRFDLASFGRSGPALRLPALLARQSALASFAASVVAGEDPQAFLPLENEWIGSAPPRPRPLLRRGAPLLDLEEICFSYDGGGRPFLIAALRGESEGEPWRAAERMQERAGDPEGSAGDPLSLEELHAFERVLAGHLRTAAAFGRFLARGRAQDLEAARAFLDEIEALLPRLRLLGPAWRATLEADRELLHAAEPWRIRFTRWIVSKAGAAEPAGEVTLARADDPRLRSWADLVEREVGGREVELWKLLPVAPGLEVTLRSEVALRDPRNARLRVEAAARRTVRLNGSALAEGLDAERGPLLVTLPLPAGANVIEVVLQLEDTSGRVGLDLDLLPHRVEGIHLDCERASRVHEPVVRLNDPTALGGSSLVRPAGRTARSGSGEGPRASLPLPLPSAQRLDVWVHVLPLADRAASLELRFDGGAPRTVAFPAGGAWTWVRAPEPATLAAGDHALHLDFPVENMRVDQVVLLPTELSFPRTPAGDKPLSATAWRFDPIGAGLVVDLPPLKAGELFGRAFTLDKGGSYDVFAWLKGSDPLAPGQWAELELSTPSGRHRFVLPAGTPYEEWVALGSTSLSAGERIELKAQGHGALARVAFVR